MAYKGKIPRDFIDNLVARADIVAIINMRVPLKKAGRDYHACCPFHNEKTPSFTVSETKQFYYCFGCGAKGTVINFIMEYERLEFVEAIEVIASHEGLDVPYEHTHQVSLQKGETRDILLEILVKANTFYQSQLRLHEEREIAVHYLQKRGITGDFAKRYGIGFAPNHWHLLMEHLKSSGYSEEKIFEAGLLSESNNNRYDRFRDRIIFPIRNRRGETIGFGGRILGDGEPKYLNSPETPLFHKGQEVYGLYELRKFERQYNEIIVVEGYMDVVMLAQHGIGNAVATLGTAISSKQIEMLLRYTSNVVFCFDGDRAGRAAANRALEESLAVISAGKELSFLFLPEGEDPDSYVQKVGAEGVREEIKTAIPLSQYLFDSFKEEINEATLEGRSQLLSSASELINRMKDIPLRDLLREALAKRVDVQESVLNKHVKKGELSRYPRKVNFHQNSTLLERILTILINNLSLAHELKGIQFLLESHDHKQNILYQVITTVQDYSEIKNFAQLYHHFSHEDWIDWLQHLSMQHIVLEDAEQPSKEAESLLLTELQELLKQLSPSADALYNKIAEKWMQGEPLTDDEKKLLQKGKPQNS